MRTATLLATVIASVLPQDKPVDLILRRFAERRAQVRVVDDFRKLARESLAALDDYIAKAPPGDADLPRALYHGTEMLISLQDAPGARARIEDFLKKYPDVPGLSAAARYLSGELHLELGDETTARERLAAFIASAGPKDERITRARTLSALSFAAQGRYDEAIAGITELRKTDERAAFPLAILHHIAGHGEAAYETLEAIIKAGKDPAAVDVGRRLLSDWLAVGKPVGDWSGTDLAGNVVRPPAGKVLVLYFFAAEYEESSQEARIMKRLAAAFAGRDLVIIGVATDKRRIDVELFLKDLGTTWPVCIDGNGFEGPLARRFNVASLPRIMVADRKGVLRFVNPVCTPYGRELTPIVERLLSEK